MVCLPVARLAPLRHTGHFVAQPLRPLLTLRFFFRTNGGADENLDWLDGQPQRSAVLHGAE